MNEFIEDLPLIWNIAIFILSGILVWRSGIKLSKFADKIIDRTGLSEVFIGTLGLALITSLPEVAITLSATFANNINIAINNLLGSSVLQITILAVGDAMISNTSITASIENPASRLQVNCLSFLLGVAAIAILYEDIPVFHVGLWSVVIFIFYLFFFYMINYFKNTQGWQSEPEKHISIEKVKDIVSKKTDQRKKENSQDSDGEEKTSRVLMSSLGLFSLLAAIGILIGGTFVGQTADVISERTGLGSSFMGFLFTGLASALPELSTTIKAVKLGRYEMAFSNIFGTTLLNVSMILLIDLFYFHGPVLNEVDNFSVAGATLGLVLISIYQMGLTLKLKKTFFRMGLDSIAVILCYIIGIIILFNMRNG